MAYSITCPSCAAKLKAATAIPIGRTIQCPKCTEKFAVSADNMVELSDSRVLTPNPQVKSTTSSARVAPLPKKPNDVPPSSKSGSRPAAKQHDDEDRGQRGGPRDEAEARSRRRPNDDDEEERPRKRRGEEDEPRARKRRDEDDEEPEERPRQRRGEEDEEEERPRARKRRDEDNKEEDDRPRSRKRRDEDADDDDRPRRNRDDEDDDDRPRKKKKKKKGGLGLKIGIGVGAVAVLGLIVGLIIWMVGGGSVDTEMLSLMPADTVKIEYANVERIVAADSKFKKTSETSEEGKFGVLKAAGLKIDDVKAVIDGRTEKDENVGAIRLKKAADKGKFTSGGTEQKAGDKAFWKLKGDAMGAMFISFPADDLIVWTRKEDLIKSILARSLGDVVISAELQDLMKKVSGGDVWQTKSTKAAANANVQVKINGVQVSKIKGAAMRTDFSGSQLTLKSYLVLDSSDEASKIVKEFDNAIEKMKKDIDSADKKDKSNKFTDAQKDALKKMVSSLTFSADGATLERSASIDIGPFNDNEILAPMLMIYLMVGAGCE